MTVPPEHLKEPRKVTIRRKKLQVRDTINRRLLKQNKVVNSKEIIMVTSLPVAEESLHPKANPLVAEQALTPDRKEVTAQILRAKRKAIHPKEKAVTRIGQTPMTGTEAVSVEAKRKVSNQEMRLIQAGPLLMTNLKGVPTAIHLAKNGLM
jgi:hypothetical protein